VIEHLHAALALANEINDSATAYVVETALENLRTAMWPANSSMPPRNIDPPVNP
jgi:DNA-binding ferritin-like protein